MSRKPPRSTAVMALLSGRSTLKLCWGPREWHCKNRDGYQPLGPQQLAKGLAEHAYSGAGDSGSTSSSATGRT